MERVCERDTDSIAKCQTVHYSTFFLSEESEEKTHRPFSNQIRFFYLNLNVKFSFFYY